MDRLWEKTDIQSKIQKIKNYGMASDMMRHVSAKQNKLQFIF